MKEKLGKYKTLIKFILLTVCVSLLIFNGSSLMNQPLSLSRELEDVSNACEDSAGNLFVIAGGGSSVEVIKNGVYAYAITGDDFDRTFSTARELCTDDSGNLFILEKVLNEDGKHVDEERVLCFSANAARRQVVYDYTAPEATFATSLDGLSFTGGTVTFCLAENDQIQEISVDPDTLEAIPGKTCPTEEAPSDLWDTQIIGQNVYYVTKTGLIRETSPDGKPKTVYDAADHNSAQYCSVPMKLAADEKGTLYFSDIGLRNIQSISSDGSLQTEIDSKNLEKGIDSEDSFENLPILSEINLNKSGDICFISAESAYDEEGNNYYVYRIGIRSGESVTFFTSFPKSILIHLKNIFCALLVLLVLFLVISIILDLKKKKLHIEFADNMKSQLPIILVSVTIAVIVCIAVLQQSNATYVGLYEKNLNNVAAFISSRLSRENVDRLSSPADFESADYKNINAEVTTILSNATNDPSIYCVLYKVQGNIVQAFYSDDLNYGVAYPMSGSYQGSNEQNIIKTDTPLIVNENQTAEGSYMFILYPVSDSSGSVYAIAEVGIDLALVQSGESQLFTRTVMAVILYTVLLLLLYGEVSTNQNILKKNPADTEKYPSRKIRPVIFLLCFATSLPTAFIPIMGSHFWKEGMPFTADFAAAIPVSAEMFAIALVNLFLGKTIEKAGTRKICRIGAVLMCLANIIYGLAPNLWVFTAGALLNGAAGGMVLLAVSAYIMSYPDENAVSEGFVHYNASYLSGLNTGIIAGSLIAESFSYSMSFYVGAAVLLLILVFVPVCISPQHRTKAIAQKESTASFRKKLTAFFRDPAILKYYFLFMVPYMFCASFGNYVFPLFGESNGLSTTQISMAFLLAGCVSIYLGETLSKLTSTYLSLKRTLVIAGITNIAAFAIFDAYPSVPGAYIAVFLFALADSYGLTALSVSYSSIKSTGLLGEEVSAGIYNMFENVSQMLGPLLFALVLQLGTQTGIFILMAGYGVLLILFAISMKEEEL